MQMKKRKYVNELDESVDGLESKEIRMDGQRNKEKQYNYKSIEIENKN